MKTDMNRRAFLTGTAATGALAALGLAGCAAGETAAPVAAEGTSAEGASAEGGSYLSPGSYAVSEERDYDVVVVGAGGAGMSAAIRAAELGMSVVLLESHPQTGGTTIFTEGLFALNSPIQKENGKNPADLGYDIFTMAMDFHHWYANGGLFRKYCDQSGENIQWLMDQGIEFSGTGTMCANEYNTWHQYVYSEGKLSGQNYVDQLTAAVSANGAEIMLNTKAIDIVMDGDTAVAIVAEGEDGCVQFNAAKGIILATGGYSDSPELMAEFGKNPDRVDPMGAGGREGFGINAARQAGGTLAPSPGCMVFYGGCIPGISYGTHLYCASAFQPYFWINQDCERFVNEYYAERNFSFSGNAQSMQDRVISIVTQAQMDNMHENGGTFGCGEYIHAGEPLTDLWDEFNAQKDGGNEAVHGPLDTLDDLAAELNLDPDALKASVEKYNGYCAAGVDEDFNKDAQYLFALEEGPYYAFELKAGIFTTVGGMKVNNQAQVLTEEGTPIPHLYAVGCDAGGLYGDSYDVSICEGSCQGFAVFTGKLAAETIVEQA
ncbi:FAD-dependent oxidoreductase [Slackia heliotrinireducens]|uniref:FAD-dependent oxidoreductase n=1 Tax=Slackia heliotrinireducens TaxID=84110 RepID=UPI0033157CF4